MNVLIMGRMKGRGMMKMRNREKKLQRICLTGTHQGKTMTGLGRAALTALADYRVATGHSLLEPVRAGQSQRYFFTTDSAEPAHAHPACWTGRQMPEPPNYLTYLMC